MRLEINSKTPVTLLCWGSVLLDYILWNTVYSWSEYTARELSIFRYVFKYFYLK